MIESILLEEQDHKQQNAHKGAKKSHWVMFILFSLLLAGAAVAVVLAFDARASNTGSSPASPPILTSPSATQMCDACTLVPNMEDHVICKSCGFLREDSKSLLCPAGYGDLTLSKVEVGGHSNSLGLAAIQNECSSQYADYFEDNGEPFACTFTLDTLEADLGQTGKIKASYVCQKNVEVETYSETPAFRLRSPSRSLPEPFLSSAQVKCDGRKSIADTVEKAKMCAVPGDASFTLSCNGGDDARIIIQKMANPVKTPAGARANKKRAQMVTNFCAAGNLVDGSCTVSPEIMLLDTETDLAGKTFEISYLCSYASSKLLLQKALDVSESGSDAPGEPLLTSALVKCGKRKEYASTVEVAKACSDQDFTLSCNPDKDPRIIILSMWDGDTKGSKTAKQRAKAATTFCRDLVGGVCTFSLSDLGETTTEAPLEPDVLADKSISVKYLCSYSSPVLSF